MPNNPIDYAFRIFKSEPCSHCSQWPMDEPCTGAKHMVNLGAGGIDTFCDEQLQEAIAFCRNDPTVDDTWIEDVEPISQLERHEDFNRHMLESGFAEGRAYNPDFQRDNL